MGHSSPSVVSSVDPAEPQPGTSRDFSIEMGNYQPHNSMKIKCYSNLNFLR